MMAIKCANCIKMFAIRRDFYENSLGRFLEIKLNIISFSFSFSSILFRCQ